MTVHIDEMRSEVQVEPDEAPGAAAAEEPPWAARERLRAVMERLQRDALRTASRGYDD